MNEQVIILYSKYSTISQRLMSLITPEFTQTVNPSFLCIDKETVRKRIITNKQFNIKKVPCILRIYSNGVVEKYEEENAYNWIFEILSKIHPPKIIMKEVQPPPPVVSAPARDPREIREVHTEREPHVAQTSIEEIDNPKLETDNPPNSTKLEMDMSDRYQTAPTKPSIRKDKGNYEYGEEIEEMFDNKDDNREVPISAHIKKQPGKVKSASSGNDIMSKAAQLAKLREQDDNHNKVNPGLQIMERPI